MKNHHFRYLFLATICCSSFAWAQEEDPAKACLALGGDQVKSCLKVESAVWDKKLNASYQEVLGYLDWQQKKAQRQQQRQWLKQRRQQCTRQGSRQAAIACSLTATRFKTLALQQQQADLVAKVFEGDWREFEKYYGDELGFVLLQKGKNICGSWSYFASRGVPGKIHARLIDSHTAQSFKICGADGGDPDAPWTRCDVPYDKWSEYAAIKLKICNNQLYTNYLDDKTIPFEDCVEITKRKDHVGSVKKTLSSEDKANFIYEAEGYVSEDAEWTIDTVEWVDEWIDKCLNYEE